MERRLEHLPAAVVRERMAAGARNAILPVGALEAHGVIGVGADTLIPVRLAEAIAGRLEALVAPAIPYGVVKTLEGHPGTVGVGSRSFRRFAGDVLESLARGGFRKILVLNGHGGQIEELKDAAYQTFHRTGAKVAAIHWWLEAREITERHFGQAGAHAGIDETAMMLAIAPHAVRADLYAAGAAFLHRPSFFAYPFPADLVTYRPGDERLDFDSKRAEEYCQLVTEHIAGLAVEIFRRWDAI